MVWPFRRVRVSYLDCWKRPSLFDVTSSPFPFLGGASLLRFKGRGLPEFLPAIVVLISNTDILSYKCPERLFIPRIPDMEVEG